MLLKQYLRHFLVIGTVFGAAAILIACGKPPADASQVDQPALNVSPVAANSGLGNSELSNAGPWQNHLEFAPRGWVSAQSALQLQFSHPVVGDAPLGQQVEGLIAVEPPLDVLTTFAADNTLTIQPAAPLLRGVEYRFTLFPNQLAGVDQNLSSYQFSVQAYQQDFGVQIEGLRIEENASSNTVSGTLSLNDGDNVEAIENILQADQEGRDLTIEWRHDEPTRHQFTITQITRGPSASSVQISWDGAAIGVPKQGSQSLVIPSLTSFEVVGATVSAGADQYITVRFSEPLDGRQSLQGLVTINGNAPKTWRVDGNALRVYPSSPISGSATVKIFPGIRGSRQAVIAAEYTQELVFLQENPGVRFKDSAHIIPDGERMVVPIEAVNVDAVQITAYRTSGNNLGQFLQSRGLQNNYLDTDTTVPLWRKTYRLPEIPKDKWQLFNLDLTEPLNKYKDDLLALEIRIDRSHSIIACGPARPNNTDLPVTGNTWPTVEDGSQPDWVSQYYFSSGRYVWQDRNNPCKDQFYDFYQNKTEDFRYLQASNIGLIAKMAVDHSMSVVATDIGSAQALNQVKVVAYNYQHQPVAQAITNQQGVAQFTPVSAPYYLIAQTENDLGFLRLPRNEALSTNVFDVGGERASSGVKGFFYGERGVWRPGDDIYLTFIVQDRSGQLPEGHPLTLDFFDPKGAKHTSVTHTEPLNNFYQFKLATEEESVTGNWRAVIRYGGQYFDKVIPIEAIVPNRLKIDMEFPSDELSGAAGSRFPVTLFSQWLNGASASALKADVEMNVRSIKTQISGYDGYAFDDPVRKLDAQATKIFDGVLDGEGKAEFSLAPNAQAAPGKLRLNFTTRVFEKSGNFSTQYSSVPYLPYDQLVGLNIPKGNGWNNAISRDENHQITLVSLDPEGNSIANSELDFELYRVDWRWWWDSSGDDFSNYINTAFNNRLVDESLRTDANGRATWELEGENYEWGRYLVRVCVKASDHCAGEVVYLGWSSNQQKNPSGDTQLILTTDKDRYTSGEVARITIPQLSAAADNNSASNVSASKVLLTIESGTSILAQRWIENDIVDGQYSIPIQAAMAPNVYAHITLIQPYLNKTNDSPVRLYGIVPLHVDDVDTRLQPVIEVADKVRPQSTIDIGVKEAQGRAMTYTLAVVDEGLLGITNYRTPDPHDQLYRRESLGVLTWDMYDLLPRNAGTLQRLITIGGSDGGDDGEGNRGQRRFPPVVKFLGPFALEANQSAQHQVELPEYMGAVRVMAVAGWQGKTPGNEQLAAYGRVEKSVTVTQPLTLLATLPRVLGPNETVSLPVNVFVSDIVTDAALKDVTIEVTATDNVEVIDKFATLHFDQVGDQIVNLQLRTANTIGAGSITVTARAGNESASQTIAIPIRTANLAQRVSQATVVEPGQTVNLSLTPNGMLNTNHTYIEVSRIPQIDLQNRLQYLIGYPHGCLEQITSKLFPQLYLSTLTTLSDQQQREVESNINAGMRKYMQFQNAAGDFNYWPNGDYSNTWSNNYAGHLLLEAKRLGYFVPAAVLDNWLSAQQQRAQNLGSQRGYESADAYTLYTLALANSANFNAMNRLKEQLTQSVRGNNDDANVRLARWMLAAAYAKAGVVDAADDLMNLGDNSAYSYQWAGYNYGSSLRDTAVLSMVYGEMSRDTQAWEAAQAAAQQLAQDRWYSTHSTAWGLMALANYFSHVDIDQNQAFSWRINNGAEEQISLLSPLMQQSLDEQRVSGGDQPVTVEIRNQSNAPFYALLANAGIPANAEETASRSGVDLQVNFTDIDGRGLDISQLAQGQDFIANVRVSGLNRNDRLENLALEMVMPSGWQVSNDRLSGLELPEGIEYQDIRDDRVLSYFTLGNYYWYHRNNRNDVNVKVKLNASYAGEFYLPGWHVYSMYDENIRANTVGRWVTVGDN